MLLLRRLLYLTAVFLSVACVCVAAEDNLQADLTDPGSPGPAPSRSGGGGNDACSSGSPDPTCNAAHSDPEASRTNCVESPEKDGCTPKETKKEVNCDNGSGDTCPNPPQEPGRTTPTPQEEVHLNGKTGSPGASAEHREAAAGEAVSGVVSSSSEPPAPTPTPPADPNPPEGSAVQSSDDGQTGIKGNNTPREGGNGDNNGITATQPSADSPNTSDTVSGDGSESTTTGNGSTTTGSETKSKPEGAVENTDTTTTTLPPEPTNNKKGDADSSSSISSSVWVRVPLLIVVTLACILVC
ncbi:uncharacterized protein TM35_000741130 [Trypanosoma theileri]|uniref:Uncharacterized protein n=1 Tax=Trypanosoma theileri TaxID=67003 RepID=A0A1X0NF71_9TRYP|nr:uncharacterized protein TM35_000741130 [Trypanosoma theileri]ORC83366.1 hypothetical protein TM35_000741130 [Trypanosoma theileri]